MAADLLRWLFEATLATSVAIVAVLSLRAPLRRACGAGVAHLAWLAVPAALVAVSLPATSTTRVVELMPMATLTAVLAPQAASTPVPASMPWAAIAWAAGALAMLAGLLVQQHRFRRALGPLRRDADGLLRSDATGGLPAVVGWWPRIVLPGDFERRFDAGERELVLCHERTHLRRGDLPAGVLAAAFRCAFWFNPLAHIAAARFGDDQELACDEAVMRRHPGRRRQYGEALLKAHDANPSPAFGTRAFGTHPLKERIRMLARPLPTPLRWLAGALSSLMLAGGVAVVAWAAQPPATGGERVAMEVRFALDGAEVQEAGTFVQDVGAPFRFKQELDGGGWSGEFSAKPAGEGRYLVSGIVRNGDEVIAEPSLLVASGREAVIELGDPDRHLWLAITARPAPAGDMEGISGAKPVFPEDLAADYPAVVMLDLQVDEHGNVTRADFVSDGSSVDADSPLVASAIAAARAWQVNASQANGIPVPGTVRVPIRFEDEAGPAPGPTNPAGGANAPVHFEADTIEPRE